jgi:hypothetical protein
MAKSADWLPRKRQDHLNLSRTWLSVFTEDTPNPSGGGSAPATVKKYAAWGIPAETFSEFTMTFAKAEEALKKASEKETRTEVTNAACRLAFDALAETMRTLKRRWLQSPPLTEADLITLGLKPADKKPTPSGPPTARVLPEIINRGQASLTLRFEYVEGSAGDPANKARRLHYKVAAQGETPPAAPDELTKSDPMNRRIETMRFDYRDSGKTVYMAVQIENGDYKGPWGPMVSAVIP